MGKARGSGNKDLYVPGRRVKARLGPLIKVAGKKRRMKAWVYGNTIESTGKSLWKVKWDDCFNIPDGEYSTKVIKKAKIYEGVFAKEIDLAVPEDEEHEDQSKSLRPQSVSGAGKTVVTEEVRSASLTMCERKIAALTGKKISVTAGDGASKKTVTWTVIDPPDDDDFGDKFAG